MGEEDLSIGTYLQVVQIVRSTIVEGQRTPLTSAYDHVISRAQGLWAGLFRRRAVPVGQGRVLYLVPRTARRTVSRGLGRLAEAAFDDTWLIQQPEQLLK